MKVATRTQCALDLSLQKMRLTSFRYVLLLFFVLWCLFYAKWSAHLHADFSL